MLELNLNENILDGIESESTKDIAIIGMDVKLPFADNIEEFWMNLINKKDCVGELPQSRKSDIEKYLRFRKQTDVNLDYASGGYLRDIDKFDNDFFNIPNKEAILMDPHQRIFLQSAWKAIEDAGYGGKKLVGSNTGVYVGFTPRGEYQRYIGEIAPEFLTLSETGNLSSIVASRISYLMDFRGPSMIVNTECSSSLVAVHLACRSLRNGECDMAIAGGVRLSFFPVEQEQKLGIESEYGKVCTFDDDSDGAVFGEGSVAIILKPLNKALKDKDNIYAIVKGSAINQDGASVGITAPNLFAQEEVIVNAWRDAAINPESISYIEAHGTGTKLGDPVEVNGINRAFSRFTDKKQFCGIGSVKTNIAHLDNVAGIASLVKVVLSLKNKKLPPIMNFKKPNRQINFEDSAVYVNDRLRDWPKEDSPRRAGISSFGLSGTNCHIVLEEAPLIPKTDYQDASLEQIFTISATKREVCMNIVESMIHYLETQKEQINFNDICYTANTGRGHYNFRIAIIASSNEMLLELLKKIYQDGLTNINDSRIHWGEQILVSNKKVDLNSNEINENQRKLITDKANQWIEENSESLTFPSIDSISNICYFYVRGADINFDLLFRVGEFRRVSIPTYLFYSKRNWLTVPDEQSYSPVPNGETRIVENTKPYLHPLLDKLVIKSVLQDIYITHFNVSKHWILREHNIFGKYMVPGTAYLEMAREIGSKFYKGGLEFRNVIFLNSLVLDENETKEVQTIIKKNKGYLEFLIVSKNDLKLNSDSEWIVYCEGQLYPISGDVEKKIDLHSIKSRCTEKVLLKKDNKNKELEDIFRFGSRWTDITRAIYIGNEQVFAEFELPEEFVGDLNEYYMHPSMLDMAVNVISQSTGKGIYLPFSYESMKMYGRIEEILFSHVKRINTSRNLETMSFSIQLFNGNEKLIAEVTNLTVKRVNKNQGTIKAEKEKEPTYFYIDYEMKEYVFGVRQYLKEPILVFREQEQVSSDVIQLLRSLGRTVIEVGYGEKYHKERDNFYIINNTQEDHDRLFQELKLFQIGQILHLMTTNKTELLGLDELDTSLDIGALSVYRIARAIINTQLIQNIDLIAVTENANLVSSEQTRVNTPNAPLIGVCKVINKELGNLKTRILDIDEYTESNVIVAEVNAKYDKFYKAFRNRKLYTEILRETQLNDDVHFESLIKEGGVYVLTGGTGGLGVQIAKALSETKNVNIIIIGRKKWSEIQVIDKFNNLLDVIDQVKLSGSSIKYYCSDVADQQKMSKIFKEIRKEYGAVNGIIHMAGIPGRGYIVNNTEEDFKDVLLPKVKGTYLLSSLTEEENLDFFINFSSISSIIGYPGQSDYVAANSFIDAFAGYGKLLNKKIISINWAPWKEFGMAVDYGLKDNGIFKMLSTKKAVNAFKKVATSSTNNIIVGNLNMQALGTLKEHIFIELSPEIKAKLDSQRAFPLKNKSEVRKVGSIKINGKKNQEYSRFEEMLSLIWARVLEVDTVDIYANFMEIGVNSILAVEILKEIDKEFPGVVSVSDVFSYPSISEMAKFIDDKTSHGQGTKENIRESGKVTKNDVLEILEQLENGTISIEQAGSVLM